MMARHRPRLVVYNPDPDPPSRAPTAYDNVPPPPALDMGRSNPPLSSPSSTSSRQNESTPPPSTPGLPTHVVDLSDSPCSPEPPAAVPVIEHPPSHSSRKSLKNFFGIGHHSSPSEPAKEKRKVPRRPQTSPTVSTPSDHPYSASYPPAGTGERIFIGVTTDWERFMPVDISGATCADFIKERILSRLLVSDEDQALTTFTFHKTSFSGQSTSEALSDDQLVQLCHEEGDPTGRLHILVHVAHTKVAEPHKLFNALSPNSSTQVPPPPIPISRPPPAQQLSRQDSVSSASESHPEPNGYEGDVDGEQPTTFKRPRPLPNPMPQPSPASPRDTHRVLPSSSPKVHTRPISPPVLAEYRYGTQGQTGFTPAGVPPLSPSRSTFPQNDEPLNLPQIKPLHTRSGSDAAAERELVQQQQTADNSGSSWNTPHGPLRSRGMSKDGRPRRGISGSDDTRYPDKDRSVPQDSTRPFIQPRNHVSNSPVRPKHSSPSIRNISIPIHPSHPPPAVPGTSHDARPPTRAPNRQVPSNWAVMWKGGDNKIKNAPVTTPTRGDRHMLNRYKSEDSLRALARGGASSHPVTLQPGRKLPMSGNPNSSEPRGTSNGLPRSYEQRKLLPMHGPVYGEQRQPSSTTLLSPSPNDPYARPNSALGENGTVLPSTTQRMMSNMRSPTHTYNPAASPTTNDPYSDRTSMSRNPGGSPHSPPRSHLELKSDSSGSSTYTPVSGLFSDLARWNTDEGTSTIVQRPTIHNDYSATSLDSPVATFMSTESDADLWNIRPRDGTIVSTPTKPKLEVQTSSYPPSEPKQAYVPSKPSPHGSGSPRTSKALMQGTFAENSWAPRPPTEVVYDRLEEFFSGHDLDRPIVESNSGGTSPTNVEPTVVPVPVPDREARARGKKSIRVVAKEHQRRVRNSDVSAIAMHRKRSTKLWGSKVEEITPLQAKAALAVPDSPTTGASTFKWVRGELIGQGTYGKVYLALNATTGEMIAVKQVELISPHNGGNDSVQEAVVEALKMESETLKDLDHPNIVSYLGFEETPQNLSIFLEYVPGGSITSCLRKHGKFDEEVTKSFTAQILLGLDYLHSKGIIHRDLKADNILVETSGVCKISDFGISKRTTDLQANTSLKGTVFWMAPEVVDTRSGGYDSKVDIWSVGCVVLEMWGGRRPWNGEASWAVMFKLFNERQPPPVPEDVVLSPLADEFRRICFALNPQDRPSAAELKNHPYLTLSPGWIFTGFK